MTLQVAVQSTEITLKVKEIYIAYTKLYAVVSFEHLFQATAKQEGISLSYVIQIAEEIALKAIANHLHTSAKDLSILRPQGKWVGQVYVERKNKKEFPID